MTFEVVALLVGMAVLGAVSMAVLFRRDAQLDPEPVRVRSRDR